MATVQPKVQPPWVVPLKLALTIIIAAGPAILEILEKQYPETIEVKENEAV